MDGSAIFNFVQTEVPPLINGLLERAGREVESVDYFLCHQPNRFMLQKLADKMKIPHSKMPNNVVERFGNSGGATIPMALTINVAEQLKARAINACLAGFGAGLTWAAMLLKLGPLSFCELIDCP
jgi:3-oxoacyl-[acyl-carrier-protein] synthase-3